MTNAPAGEDVRVRPAATFDPAQRRERPEAEADDRERQAGRHVSRVRDRVPKVAVLLPPAAPRAVALPDTPEVEPQGVPALVRDDARQERDERVAHRAAVRRQRVRDHDDRGRRAVGDPERPLEPARDPLWLFPHREPIRAPFVCTVG
jgi:hypothetical protein